MDNPLSALDALIFFKIDGSVGKGGANRNDDVQKVQLMLNYAHLDAENSFRMASILAMDGICGPKTLAAILAYQQHKKQNGPFPLLVADGLVSATPHAAFVGRGYFGFSTIYVLNQDLLMAMPRTNLTLMGAYMVEPLYSMVILPLRKARLLS